MELLAGLGPIGVPELLVLVFLAGIVGIPIGLIVAATRKQEAKARLVEGVPPASLADHLEKLAALRASGALTEDEFQAAKAAAMSSPR